MPFYRGETEASLKSIVQQLELVDQVYQQCGPLDDPWRIRQARQWCGSHAAADYSHWLRFLPPQIASFPKSPENLDLSAGIALKCRTTGGRRRRA
jgi:hypothetical protein